MMRSLPSADWLRVDSLDERWRVEAPPPNDRPAPGAPEAEDPLAPLAWCVELAALTRARFGEGAAITRLVDEMGRLAKERFGGKGTGDPGELDARIEELIAHVEDLADCDELRRRR